MRRIKNPKLLLGLSDFKTFREEGYYYVDKSSFIRRVIHAQSNVMLFPRPRRFGKTLNLSMLYYFFEKTERNSKKLFEGLEIFKDSAAMKKQGQHPVVSLSFKDVKVLNWDQCYEKIKQLLAEAFLPHRRILEETLQGEERLWFEEILSRKQTQALCEQSLGLLVRWLHQAYGSKSILLIDEYDTPILNAFQNGYYAEAISFFRNLLSAGLKDNSSLEKGVITGILRIAKESIFSGLNNLWIYSILNEDEFNDSFGFTQKEVLSIFKNFHLKADMAAVNDWYNGYVFGKQIIYNPWSIMGLVKSSAKDFIPYWANTSNLDLMKEIVARADPSIQVSIEMLLTGNEITKEIHDHVVLQNLWKHEEVIWALLLYSGYLRLSGTKTLSSEGRWTCNLSIPNREVRATYLSSVSEWMREGLSSAELQVLLSALLKGDAKTFQKNLQMFVTRILSYHDTARTPEALYHGFVLGLLANLGPKYGIKSNRESGFGRYDVIIFSKETAKKSGIVLEFKSLDDDESQEIAIQKAAQQIQENEYETELLELGIQSHQIFKMVVLFSNKKVWVHKIS